MPIRNIEQPIVIEVDENIRLLKFNGNYEIALSGYQDPYVYQNSEGIFDDTKKPDINYIKGMFEWLNNNGELYYIQIREDQDYISIGDVTIKDVNPPITIWYEKYRSIGIGTKVMKIVIRRLKELGYDKITGTTVYKWNESSQKMHEKLGFVKVDENDNEYIYELNL